MINSNEAFTCVIVDEAFFGAARTGTINGIRYPVAIRPDNAEEMKNLGLDELLQRTGIGELSEQQDEANGDLVIGDEIIVIRNALVLAQRPKRLLSVISKIREKFGFSRLIYLPGISDPYLLPVLVYAGVSIFDLTYAILEGRTGLRYGPLGKIRTENDASAENVTFVNRILSDLCESISNGTLRDLVEKVTISSKSVEFIRLLDFVYHDLQEESFPRRTPSILANSLQSLSRPDITRYRDYVSKTYIRPGTAEILLLLPCSARKPYSTSRTHRRLISALGNLRKYLHEVIVTSPVGLVPRDLERAYPPAFYDIPVIGQWYDEEKTMIIRMIKSYLSRNRYSNIVAFVPEDLEFIVPALPEGSVYLTWEKGSEEEFQDLKETISGIAADQHRPKRDYLREEITSVCTYSYGQWIEPYISKCKIFSRYDRYIMLENGQSAIVYDPETGRATIGRGSAEWFLKKGKFLVEIDDFRPTSNIYPVGIVSVTEDVRPGDDVVVHCKGELRGVGTAKMPRSAMLTLKKGVAVKMRN
ncbi:MAG TPA: DUF5591 domain-containing protein [Thermoplasmataceae archaeon]|nr:DUF5591 domain-containing protein [Thermoplasmataceae archaeon]